MRKQLYAKIRGAMIHEVTRISYALRRGADFGSMLGERLPDPDISRLLLLDTGQVTYLKEHDATHAG